LLVFFLGIVAAQPAPAELISRAQPGEIIFYAAPSIKDPDVARAIAKAAYSGVMVAMVLDARGALDPNAYTRHLSTVPGVIIRLAGRQRASVLIYKGIVLEGDGIWSPGQPVRVQRERGQAAWFSRLFLRARPYVYVPKAPPGYRIVEEDPAIKALQKIDDAFERAYESMYGGSKK